MSMMYNCFNRLWYFGLNTWSMESWILMFTRWKKKYSFHIEISTSNVHNPKYITVQQIVNVIILPFSFVEKDFATKKISYPRICLEFRFYHFYFPKFCMSFIHSYVYLYLFSKCLAYYCLYLKISAHNYSRLILSKCGCFFNSAPLLLLSRRFSLIEGVLCFYMLY